jgi:hypothetical protein
LVAVNAEVSFGTLADVHVVASRSTGVMLSWSHDFVLRIVQEFVPVREPSNYSGNHEEHGEHVSGESHSFVDDSTVEINVRVQLSVDEVGVTECNLFEFDGDLD